jgi:hypothetical protein
MTFTLSDHQCSLAAIITVNDRKSPVYGFRAKVARVKYKRHGTEIAPSVWGRCQNTGSRNRQAVPKMYKMM